MKESIQSKCFIDESDDEQVFCLLIRSMYCTSLKVPTTLLVSLMIMADKYQMTALFDKCVSYLTENISYRNCLDIWILEDDIKYKTLIQGSINMIRSTLRYIILERLYVILRYEKFCEFLTKFCIGNVKDLCEIIYIWINHDREGRKLKCVDLLDFICKSSAVS